jgi:hypothetical protein
MLKSLIFSISLLFSFSSQSVYNIHKNVRSNYCITCDDEKLEKILSQIKEKIFLEGATLTSENRFPTTNIDTRKKVVWQGSINYCDGQCTSIITVTQSCFLFFCSYSTSEDPVTPNCECGDFCPCTFVD